MSIEKVMRRVPRQQRSQRRVEVILNAAAELVSEMGYEAMTTSLIAERADTSIGSLYQFFPNKDAVLQALAKRYLGDMRLLTSRLFTPDVEYVPLPVLVDRTINALVEFENTHPGFTLIFNSAGISEDLKAAADSITEAMITDFERVISLKAPSIHGNDRRSAAQIAMSIIKGVLPLTMIKNSEQRDRVIIEFKRALLSYLSALTDAT